MPIYAYRCDDCGFEKDVLQKFSDAALTDCPQCHKPAFNRMVSAPAFQLKGTGWYVTDFRGGNSGKPGAKQGGGAGESSGASAPAAAESSAGGDSKAS
jgi:putative FmdB family regulatory protein